MAMERDIQALAQRLELHHPEHGTRTWGDLPVSRLDMATGERAAVPPDQVPQRPTGMLVRSGIYDVNRFVWGSRNLTALVVHMKGNDIFHNEPDAAELDKLLDTSFQGTPIFGAGVSHHTF